MEKGEGSSSSKLCNPESIINHRWEASEEGFLHSFVVVKHQKELIKPKPASTEIYRICQKPLFLEDVSFAAQFYLIIAMASLF